MANAVESSRLRSLPVVGRIIKQIEASSIPPAEESIALRVLAQAMVLIGIIAMDLVAESDEKMSYWAIPLSIIGAVLSWRTRHRRNTAIKFCLAILMLLALVAFFGGLRTQSTDTRLVLAELLVRLQVLHTFDLPRRKDLGYSMVIGLILIGVASTLSQTMSFGLLLLLFLAIALPVLVLDYRSRLGLQPQIRRTLLRQAGLSPKRMTAFLLGILALGLAIFALMPRLPGYQLRTFPVSAQMATPQDFDSSSITNPGYVRRGDPTRGNGTSAGRAKESGPGQVDETFYYGFNTRINQNLRGEMKPREVMRVRSQAPGYWRVLAFDRYLGQGWEISRNDKADTINRSTWTYQFTLPPISILGRRKEVVQTYTIVSELPNLIPALMQPKELFFPTQKIGIDPDGNLRSPLELIEGLTYTVISDVPYRNRSELQKAPETYPSKIRKYYLDVPEKVRDRVRQRTEELLATSEKPITSPYEKALFLAQALKQRYSIQPEMEFLKPEEDLVEAFLFKYKGGYPDHFSTTLTIMLRSIGIPARLVVGFGTGRFNPFTGLYVVQNTDAYALTEVYFPRHGWFTFDPIPGHELFPPSIEEDQTFTVLQQFWNWIAGWLPSPVTGILARVFGTIAGWFVSALNALLGLFSRGWLGLFAAVILATGLSFLSWLGWQGWKRWRYQRWLAQLPPMERLYQQMLNKLGQQGFRKRPSQTPLEFARQSWEKQPPSRAAAIDEISQAYVRWRYGGQAPNLEQLGERFQQVAQRQPKQR